MNGKVIAAGCLAIMFAVFGTTHSAVANEEHVTIDQVPVAVKAAIEQAVAGNKITEIEKETEDGKIVYEVEFVRDGKEEEASFTEDGQPVADDDDDKGDVDHDDEDDGEDKD